MGGRLKSVVDFDGRPNVALNDLPIDLLAASYLKRCKGLPHALQNTAPARRVIPQFWQINPEEESVVVSDAIGSAWIVISSVRLLPQDLQNLEVSGNSMLQSWQCFILTNSKRQWGEQKSGH